MNESGFLTSSTVKSSKVSCALSNELQKNWAKGQALDTWVKKKSLGIFKIIYMQ